MSHPLQERLNGIRRRIRQVLWLYGISCVVITIFSSLLIVGLCDWLLHLDDEGLRLLFGLSILAGCGWVAFRFLFSPLRVQFKDVTIARCIEQRYPGFKDSLSSTVQFIEEGHRDGLGSPELQERVVQQTLETLERLDISDVFQPRSVVRIGTVAVLVCLVTATIVGFNQAEAATALRRIVLPFSNSPWPRQTVLRLLNAEWEPIERDEDDPLRIARGDTLELFVENMNGSLPFDLKIEYRIDDSETVSEPTRTVSVRRPNRDLRELGTASLAINRGPIAVRAVGGDDRETAWTHIKVVPPPLLDEFRVRVVPPAYTGLPPEELPAGVGHLEGFVGSKVTLTGRTNKPLSSARLRLKNTETLNIELSGDGRDITTSFVINEPGTSSYWFELSDHQGFENAEAPRYEMRGIADQIPDVYIEHPSTDVHLTPFAKLPLKINAKDDLQLTDVRIRYRRSDSESDPLESISLHNGGELGSQFAGQHTWQMAPLQLQPGHRIVFHAEATDAYDLDGEHVGRSVPRTILIVSPEEKRAELAAEQAEILDKLEEAHEIQDRANRQVEQLRTQLDKAGQLRREDVDLLKRVEMDQNRVSASLLNSGNSLAVQVDQVRTELEDNGIAEEEVVSRLQQLADELEFLRRETLPNVERALIRARKSAQPGAIQNKESDSPPSPTDGQSAAKPSPSKEVERSNKSEKKEGRSNKKAGAAKNIDLQDKPDEKSKANAQGKRVTSLADSLAETEVSQEAVLDSLEAMRELVSRWERRREITHDLEELTNRQNELNEKTSELGRELLSRPTAKIQPQEEADLAKLGAEQAHVAEQMDQFRRKLSVATERADIANTPERDALEEATDQLRREATAGKMRDAADQLGSKSTLGQAIRNQEAALEELQKLAETLSGSTTDDTETLVKKLKQAEEELELVKQEQQELLRKTEEVNQQPAGKQKQEQLQSLRKEQEELNKKTLELVRRLRRMKAHQARESLQRSSEAMKRAQSGLQGENPEESSTEEMQEVLDDLEQAQRELAQQRRDAEEILEQEQLERIADELKGLIARQTNVIEETVRLGQELQKQQRWTRPRLASLRRLADVETVLKERTAELAEEISKAEVYALALKGASRFLETAVTHLKEKEVGEKALRAERAALTRFQQLVASLSQQNDEPKQAPGQQEEESQPQQSPPGDGIPSIAELRMLITLQEDLNARTEHLDGLRDKGGKLSADQQQELEQIAAEQGELADLARNMMQYFAPPEIPDDKSDQPAEKEADDESAKPLLKAKPEAGQ